MNIGSICSRRLITINASDSIQQAALLMREHHVGSLVVTDATTQDVQVAGIVTDRDLAIDALARGADALDAPIIDFVHDEPLGAPDSTELTEAVEMMRNAGVRRLLVHDGTGKLVGLVSFDDLVPACVAPLVGLAGVLRQEIAREHLEREALVDPAPEALRMPSSTNRARTGTSNLMQSRQDDDTA